MNEYCAKFHYMDPHEGYIAYRLRDSCILGAGLRFTQPRTQCLIDPWKVMVSKELKTLFAYLMAAESGDGWISLLAIMAAA